MYDQYSDDGSRELAASLGIEVRDFGRQGTLNDQWYLDVKNNCWKECKAKGIDYVIVCDIDEFLKRPTHLTCSSPSMIGFDMISDTLPENDIWEVNMGGFDMNYGKQVIFSPDRIEEINFTFHFSIGIIPLSVKK